MADSFIGLPTDGAGKKLDAEQLTVGANTVQRERMQVVGAAAAEIARVLNTDPTGTEYALIARLLETNSAQVTATSQASIAAGGQATLESAQINSGKTGKLMGLLVSSSLPFKAELSTVSNGTATTKAIWVASDRGWDWKTPGREFVKVAQDAGVGLDGFRVVATNLDTSQPGNIYCSFFYDEV